MEIKDHLRNIERRSFLRILSLTFMGALIYSRKIMSSFASQKAKSNVIVISNSSATNSTLQSVDESVVKSMVDDGIKTFTGITNVGGAWKTIFPGITANSKIGIKVSTLFSTKNNGTHPQIAKAVTDGLIQMDFGGPTFPPNNIIIFDHPSNYLAVQGYTLNSTNTGVRCFPTSTYSSENYNVSGVSLKISTIITQQVDYFINIGCLKQHSITGVTLCLKNLYGTINNPGACHGNYGDPYIPAIAAFAPIKSKQKFCIIDALYGVTSNGPGGSVNCNPNKIIMGQDIVAVDYTGRELLKSLGLASGEFTKATHIDTAATGYSLGTNSPDQINVINIAGSSGVKQILQNEKNTRLFQNFPNPFKDKNNIQFYLQTIENVRIRIIDYDGRNIVQIINKRLEPGMHSLVWNGLDSSNRIVHPGIYLCNMKTESYHKSILIQKV